MRWRRWRYRWLYATVGAALALGAPAGLLVLQSALAGTWPSLSLAIALVRAEVVTYTYLTFSSLLVFVLLGWLLGVRDERLSAESHHDPLTGLANRRYFSERLREELARARRYEIPLSVLLIDVDHLKPINDQRGHEVGDAVLCVVAETLRSVCRASDLPARVGGDEFAVLAASTAAAQGVELANRLRAGLKLASIDSVPSPTVSVGVADLEIALEPTSDALLHAVDVALYSAKTGGRDRVATAPLDTKAWPKPVAWRRTFPRVDKRDSASSSRSP